MLEFFKLFIFSVLLLVKSLLKDEQGDEVTASIIKPPLSQDFKPPIPPVPLYWQDENYKIASDS